MTTRVHLLHPALRTPNAPDPDDALDEARALARAIDVDLAGSAVVAVPKVNPATLFGSGKVDEIATQLAAGEIDVVVVNGELSPVQQRNLERAWKVKVLDRTGLILEIFGERAQTREGVMQVDLAHLTYQKSRLVRSWTHLERQRGATGFIGGPGETQIEADRRVLDEKIVRLKRQLEKVVRTRSLHRAARKKIPHPVVALVGYTNAGKSTLFNRLTQAEVRAEDMLFATLDPTMRQITLPSGRTAILSDTVGFISDLPTQLVAAFRATLEEVLEADLIVHVRNIAHPRTAEQNRDVLGVLTDLGVAPGRLESMVELRNKIDLLEPEAQQAVRNAAGRGSGIVAGSAVTGEGCDALLAEIEARLFPRRMVFTLNLGHGQGRAAAWLYSHGEVKHRSDSEEGAEIAVEMTEKEFFQFRKEFGIPAAALRRTELAAQ
ncbi:MAG TPA: GTPase HflX [Thermohalobaculum sp.]|nr:GTPase HflX [Thermohalobaculum sp.]